MSWSWDVLSLVLLLIGGSRETRSTDHCTVAWLPNYAAAPTLNFLVQWLWGRRAHQLHGSSPTYLFHRTKRWTWWKRQKQGAGKLAKTKQDGTRSPKSQIRLKTIWLLPPSLEAMSIKLLFFSHRIAMFCPVLRCLATCPQVRSSATMEREPIDCFAKVVEQQHSHSCKLTVKQWANNKD